MELRDHLGILEHDLRDERAGLQVPAALELEEVALRAGDRAGVQPLEQDRHGRTLARPWTLRGAREAL
jgi:hypothetical protein